MSGFVKRLAEWAVSLHAQDAGAIERHLSASGLGREPAAILSFQAMRNWARDGLNSFRLSEPVTAGLLLTEVADPLHLPFRAFVVQVPRGFFVVGERDYQTALIGGEMADGKRQADDRPTVGNARLCSLFPAGLAPEDSIGFVIGPGGSYVGTEENEAVARAWMRLLASMVSFIEAIREELDDWQGPARKSASEERARPRWIEIGRRVVLARPLVDAAREIARGESSRRGVRLASRHVVRGHYRAQAHGEGGSERKTIWVQPYWRGPDGEKAWAHIYELKP